MLVLEKIMKRAEDLYEQAKWPNKIVKEGLALPSDQVKSLARALVEELSLELEYIHHRLKALEQ